MKPAGNHGKSGLIPLFLLKYDGHGVSLWRGFSVRQTIEDECY